VAEETTIQPSFRYWVDYLTYLNRENSTLEYALALEAAGGHCTGGTRTKPDIEGPEYFKAITPHMGPSHMDEWDVLYSSPPQLVAEALSKARPGQLVAGIPGAMSIAMKSSLFKYLEGYYGKRGAWAFVPVTFLLPDDYKEWQAWIKEHPDKVSYTAYWLFTLGGP
jgi:hypothetical protein